MSLKVVNRANRRYLILEQITDDVWVQLIELTKKNISITKANMPVTFIVYRFNSNLNRFVSESGSLWRQEKLKRRLDARKILRYLKNSNQLWVFVCEADCFDYAFEMALACDYIFYGKDVISVGFPCLDRGQIPTGGSLESVARKNRAQLEQLLSQKTGACSLSDTPRLPLIDRWLPALVDFDCIESFDQFFQKMTFKKMRLGKKQDPLLDLYEGLDVDDPRINLPLVKSNLRPAPITLQHFKGASDYEWFALNELNSIPADSLDNMITRVDRNTSKIVKISIDESFPDTIFIAKLLEHNYRIHLLSSQASSLMSCLSELFQDVKRSDYLVKQWERNLYWSCGYPNVRDDFKFSNSKVFTYQCYSARLTYFDEERIYLFSESEKINELLKASSLCITGISIEQSVELNDVVQISFLFYLFSTAGKKGSIQNQLDKLAERLPKLRLNKKYWDRFFSSDDNLPRFCEKSFEQLTFFKNLSFPSKMGSLSDIEACFRETQTEKLTYLADADPLPVISTLPWVLVESIDFLQILSLESKLVLVSYISEFVGVMSFDCENMHRSAPSSYYGKI